MEQTELTQSAELAVQIEQTEMSEQERQAELERQKKALKKSVRKDGSKAGFSMLGYAIISLVVSLIWLTVEVLIKVAKATVGITDTTEQDIIYDEIYEQVAMQSGTYMIVGVIIGVILLFIYFHKSGVNKQLFKKENKMTPALFGGIACVFLGGQLVFQWTDIFLEAGLNLIGYTAESSVESATMQSTTISMFIYAGIVGPIAEELIYRGFVMRLLEKHGKMLAVVVSSVLFSVMHANLPQSIFAFFVGLVLGYVAIEYSIVWSIALHILNNMVLGDLLSMFIGNFSETVQTIVFYSIFGVCLIIGIIVLIRKRQELGLWIKNNMWEKPRMRWVMTTVGMILFVGLHIVMAIGALEKLEV